MIHFLKEYISQTPSNMISYAEYIELALYHPEYGYYMNDKMKIGREGDFITTSNISDIYGRLIAKWYIKMAEKYELPYAVCEIGAGSGRFSKAFLDQWNKLTSQPVHYYIAERSPYHRELQKQAQMNVRQMNSLDELKNFQGLIFSNELFDAFPVHVIEKQNQQWMEAMITVESNQLKEKLVPLKNNEILTFLSESGLQIRNGQRIEIPLQMENMLMKISDVLIRGMVLTVDYGYTNDEWMHSGRREGSLRGYYKHQQINNVLQHPGEMDITSHVHFDSLIKIGQKNGLDFLNKWRQDEFFLSAGILEELQDHYDPNPFSEVSKRNRAIRSLVIPSGISAFFHVILQGKGL